MVFVINQPLIAVFRIIRIKGVRDAPFKDGFFQAVLQAGQLFIKIELRMRNDSGKIIDKGDEIGFRPPFCK